MKQNNTNHIVEKRAAEAEKFVDSLVSVADYLNSVKEEHYKKGKFYKKAKKVLIHYRTMKFYSMAFATNISADQCRREIRNRNEDLFEYYMEYENLPYENSDELPTIASVYDVYDFCNDTFTYKELEKYINSRKASFETILTSFCEQVLLSIKKKDKNAFNALYVEFFDLSTENMTAQEKWDYVGVGRNTYYYHLDKGITMFSRFLFSPYGQMDIEEDEKHKELIEHLKKASELAVDIISEQNTDY